MGTNSSRWASSPARCDAMTCNGTSALRVADSAGSTAPIGSSQARAPARPSRATASATRGLVSDARSNTVRGVAAGASPAGQSVPATPHPYRQRPCFRIAAPTAAQGAAPWASVTRSATAQRTRGSAAATTPPSRDGGGGNSDEVGTTGWFRFRDRLARDGLQALRRLGGEGPSASAGTAGSKPFFDRKRQSHVCSRSCRSLLG
jgi:hypothetical protein